MLTTLKALLLSAFISPLAQPASATSQTAPTDEDRKIAADWAHEDLERMYTDGAFDSGILEAKAQLERNPNDVDLYWHVARFLYEIGERHAKDAAGIDKEAIYEEMLEVSNRGLHLDPDHPHLLFARGIATGRLGTTRGVIASLFMAEDLETDWLRVAESRWEYSSLGGEEVLPCDAYSALGILYRLVPDWWIVEVIAGMRGDLDASLAYLQRANDCSPDRMEIVKEYAVIRICYGQRHDNAAMVDAGIRDLHRMLTFTPRKPTDHTDLRHAQMLIDAPELACEYSRDGQAESHRSELEH